jgi:hypothetical protein
VAHPYAASPNKLSTNFTWLRCKDYRYEAVDSLGNTINFRLSATGGEDDDCGATDIKFFSVYSNQLQDIRAASDNHIHLTGLPHIWCS